jgi:hypothetical protein
MPIHKEKIMEDNTNPTAEAQIETANGTEPAQTAAPELTVSDLTALRTIVEVASQRGAFKAAELEAVGKVFNKLNTFLESIPKKEA